MEMINFFIASPIIVYQKIFHFKIRIVKTIQKKSNLYYSILLTFKVNLDLVRAT